MSDKRPRKAPLLVLMPLALLAACNEEPTDDGRAASGEVLEGTISDAMLPVDRVRSEPPLEDPEAFAKVRSAAERGAGADQAAEAGEATEREQPAAEGTAGATPEAAPEAGDQ